VSLIVLVVDDEADVEALFRQQFRRDLRAGHFTMDFARSADKALQRISEVAVGSLSRIDAGHPVKYFSGSQGVAV
jgi:CheY-like chemotaxis protein